MIGRAILIAIIFSWMLPTALAEERGVVLLKNGRRVFGRIEVVDWGVKVHRPHGLEGTQYIQKSEILYYNEASTEIPKDFLAGGSMTSEDRARQIYQEEYRRVEAELSRVIGIARKKMERVRKREDELLRARPYRVDSLGFAVRPPKGWSPVREGNLVMFRGPQRQPTAVQPRIHVLSMRVPGITFDELVKQYIEDLQAHHGGAAQSWIDFGSRKFTDQEQWAATFTVRGEAYRPTKTRRFLVKKGHRVFLLILFTDPSEDERNFEIFRHWKDTFKIL